MDRGWLLYHLSGREGENTIGPLTSVNVNVAQELREGEREREGRENNVDGMREGRKEERQ